MITGAAIGATPLDDFLSDAGAASERGELLQQIGLIGSLSGIALAGGLLVFLAVVHRGTHREVGLLLRVIAIAGALALVGAAVEIAGVGSVGDLTWSDALTDSSGSAPMMRLLAGLLIVLGLFDHTVPVDDEPEGEIVRWIPASASAFGYVGVAIGMISFWFDGHTVSEGPRVVHAAVNLLHVAAGSVWFGGLVGLTVLAWARRRTDTSIALAVIRFSAIASVALMLVAAGGVVMALMIIDGLGDLTGTDWGRVLLVKTGAVAVAAAVGGYNHFVVVPALERAESAGGRDARARSTVTVEAVLLVFVVVMTVFLTTASTN